MPKAKYYRVGERPPPRGPVTDRLWQPPPRPEPDAADTPASEPKSKSQSKRRAKRRRSLRSNAPPPVHTEAA